MKKLLILTAVAAAATFIGNVETVQAGHCPSGGSSFGSFGSSYRSYSRPSYGYSSYRPTYSSYGYRPSYSSYGYRPSYYSRGNSFGFSSRGLSITFGSGNRGSFGRSHSGHRH
jgi:hypothetical protein